LRWLSVALLFGFLSLLVYQRHLYTGYFNWRSKMWGDAVGYYIYSPAFFIYHFDASKLPENIVAKTGEGFTVNEKGKIITRYSCGVAILQMPVFLAVHSLAGFLSNEKDGFSGIYHLVTSIAAVIYTFLGLLLLWRFLRYYFDKDVTFFSMVSVFAGTNLIYYAIDATGMSHIYSFFLFSALLVLSKQFFKDSESKKRYTHFILICLVSALIILIRPTNIVFVALAFLLDVSSFRFLMFRLKKVFTPWNTFILLMSFFVVFLPQIIYWKYAYGSYFPDPYQGFGFTNWSSPRIVEFLFSPNNGLFLYNPLYFMILFLLFLMMWKKLFNGYLILILFSGLVYVFSSWFIFSFGCGFGSRNFVEYTTVFALPMGYLFQNLSGFKARLKRFLIIFTLFFVLINLKLVSAYDKCFLGKDWDFKEYFYFLENRHFNKGILIFRQEELNAKKEFSKGIRINLKNNTLVNCRRALVSVNIRLFSANTEAMIVLSITSGDSTLYWNGYPLKNGYDFTKPGTKQKLTGDFWLPRSFTTKSEISTYVWNSNKDSLLISGLKIHLR
jgi:hypothetical protein